MVQSRDEEAAPTPFPLAPAPSSGLSHNGDASYALYRQEGAAERTPTANSGLPPASRARRPLNTTGAPTRGCFSSASVLFPWFSVFLEKKSCFRGQAGQSLPWGPGRGVGPFPIRKGKEREGGEQTCCQPSQATHCAISSNATIPPQPFYFF